ncbi:endonuclease/exonuclease/phosphatase family protein [Candidatus Nomurabacteria bacterium]|nr:endonuclease/exonuclease/phosphatase family protein [Candidatus Nomurabacteria bacterium]MCB9819584.1 endonuclease/exonuclease/phosphatase family protein [Candidatus Nomurabacteria bacterium]
MKFVSVNIEGSKHLDKIKNLLEKEKPDVICLQELYDHDIKFFEDLLHMDSVFAPMRKYADNDLTKGIGIFAKSIIDENRHLIFGQLEKPAPVKVEMLELDRILSSQYFILQASIEISGLNYNIVTTHLPVTEKGEVTQYQRDALKNMLDILNSSKELVLCGDFNAPRGREIFTKITEQLKDNVPLKYLTSIDGNIHKAGPLPYMVDGLFTTKQYEVSNVRLVSGVSDHMAVVAEIEKV